MLFILSFWMRSSPVVRARLNANVKPFSEKSYLKSVLMDPDSLNPDPDPAFQVNPDLDSRF